MALKLIAGPDEEPVTLAAIKEHLRIDSEDDPSEDGFLIDLITASRQYCEAFQNRAYFTQTWELWLDAWPEKDYIKMPLPPLQTVAHIKYYDTGNTEYTMTASDYFVDNMSEPGRLALAYGKAWPATVLRPTNGIAVQFIAGYVTVENIPAKVKQAIKLLCGHWYENREAVLISSISKETEFALKALLWLDRVVPV